MLDNSYDKGIRVWRESIKQAWKEALQRDKKYLQETCAWCEDFERVLGKKDGWCTSCEIFKTLAAVNRKLEEA